MDYWIRATDGQTYGPASLATMNRWIAEGRVIASTPVSYSPDGPWREATMVPELAVGFGVEPIAEAAAPPTQPTPPQRPDGEWPPAAIAVPQLVAGIFNILNGIGAVAFLPCLGFGGVLLLPCLGLLVTVPLVILGCVEIASYAQSRRMPALAYLGRSKTCAILDIVTLLAGNVGSAVCGIIVLTQLDAARQRALAR